MHGPGTVLQFLGRVALGGTQGGWQGSVGFEVGWYTHRSMNRVLSQPVKSGKVHKIWVTSVGGGETRLCRITHQNAHPFPTPSASG